MNKRLLHFVLAGTCLSLAALIRPTPYYLIGLFAVILAFRNIRYAAMFLAPCVIILGSWHAINWLHYGATKFAPNKGKEMWLSKAGGVLRITNGWDKHKCVEWMNPVRHKLLSGELDNIWQMDAIYAERATEIILAHPYEFAQSQVMGVCQQLFPADNTFSRAIKFGYSAWEFYSIAFFFIVFVATVWYLSTHKWRIFDWFIVIAIVYMLLVCAGGTSRVRHRLPLMPFFCTYTGLFVVSLKRR